MATKRDDAPKVMVTLQDLVYKYSATPIPPVVPAPVVNPSGIARAKKFTEEDHYAFWALIGRARYPTNYDSRDLDALCKALEDPSFKAQFSEPKAPFPAPLVGNSRAAFPVTEHDERDDEPPELEKDDSNDGDGESVNIPPPPIVPSPVKY